MVWVDCYFPRTQAKGQALDGRWFTKLFDLISSWKSVYSLLVEPEMNGDLNYHEKGKYIGE